MQVRRCFYVNLWLLIQTCLVDKARCYFLLTRSMQFWSSSLLFTEILFSDRAGRVCRLWNSAASSPALWRSVSIGYCWIEPGKRQIPGTEQKIKNTIDWLTQNRLVMTAFNLKASLQIVQ